MTPSDVVLDRETANDEEAQVVAIHVLSGTAVSTGELIFDIENSKATQEVLAPRSGILIHDLAIGHNVAFGVPIARIVSVTEYTAGGSGDDAALAAPVHEHKLPVALSSPAFSTAGVVPAGGHGPDNFSEERHDTAVRRLAEPHVSHAAAALLERSGLSPHGFNTDFITSRDVEAYLSRGTQHGLRQTMPETASKTVLPKPGQPLPLRKRAEIEVLSTGAGGTMLSVLGTSLGALAVPRPTGSFLAGRMTDLLIYEASRLMRKFSRLNAFYQDGHVVLHHAVHAGLAIDDGGRLMVYGIENADRVGLSDLADIMADAVARYVDNELTATELSRATFTVTDLSGNELDFVLPLLPRGQSCIIGVTQSASAGFRLFVGFDHRVTEGREVAAFLSELRNRLLSYAEHGPKAMASPSAHCAFCSRSLTDAVGKSNERGLLKIVNAENREVLCCGSCWNGW